MTREELKDNYNQTDWGKLLIEFGYDPYDTESSARNVARKAAAKIAILEKTIKTREDQLRRIAESVEHLLPPK